MEPYYHFKSQGLLTHSLTPKAVPEEEEWMKRLDAPTILARRSLKLLLK